MKKSLIITISICSIGIAAVILLLSNFHFTKTEKDIIQKNVSIILPSTAQITYSRGFKQNWFGEGVQFFICSMDDSEWKDFVDENNFTKWDKLPANAAYKKSLLKAIVWLTEEESQQLSKSMNGTTGHSLMLNWDQFSNQSSKPHFPNQNLIICIISEIEKKIYYCEIDARHSAA